VPFTILSQEANIKKESIQKVNKLMLESKGKTKWKIDVSNGNFIVQSTGGGPKQIFPIKEMSSDKVKFSKKGNIKHKGKWIPNYDFSLRPIKGGGVYHEAFKQNMNRAFFPVSYEEKGKAKKLHALLIELVNILQSK
jgi:hypothetical protein